LENSPEDDDSLYLVTRDEKCNKITLIISSKNRMTGANFIDHLVNFVEAYEETAQEILDTAPKITSH
jgi:hypothetical protein